MWSRGTAAACGESKQFPPKEVEKIKKKALEYWGTHRRP
jgi:hypothetical protein